jgi:tetratricopeptide (TPR) repeat protein
VFVGHPCPRARVISVLGGGAVTAALLILIFFTPLGARLFGTVALGPQPTPTDTQTEELSLQVDESAQTRLSIYRIAFEMVRERPLLGFGPDNLMVGIPRFRSEHEASEVQQSQPTSAHSWVAHIAASSGLVGLGSFLATIGVALFLTLKRGFRPAAWAGMAMVGAFLGAGLLTINDVSTEWLLWASLGMVAAATAQPAPANAEAPASGARDRPRAPRATTSRRVVAWTFAAIGLALVVFAPSALEASRRAQFALETRLAGRHAQAIDPGLLATRLDPGRAEYWDGLGLAYIGAQRVSEAAAAFEQAVKLEPYSIRMLGQLARAYAALAQRGDRPASDRAREVAERLVGLDPNNERSHQTRALVMQVTGNLPEAVRSIERAFAIAPQSGNAALYVTASQVYLSSGRVDDAIRVARQGTALVSPLPSVDIRVELARALAAKGMQKEAISELDQALLIQPGHRAAQALRAELSSRVPSS